MEEQEMQEQEAQTAEQQAIGEQETRTFTQEQVNEIVRKRLERAESRVYSQYGASNAEDFEAIARKALSYDSMKAEYDELTNQKSELEKELLLIKANVDPKRYGDVNVYFKGTEQELNKDTLQAELENHPEWLKHEEVKEEEKPKTTMRLSPTRDRELNSKTEAELAAQLFGLKSFVK